MYEIEAIVGAVDENNPNNSPLRDYATASATKQNFHPDSVIGCVLDIGVSAVGEVISDDLPVISDILSVGQTLYSMYEAAVGAYPDPITVVNHVTCSYEITMMTTMRYVFIKPQGSTTEGNQILGYLGNKTNCKVEVSKPSGKFETGPDGERYEIQDEYSVYGSVKSKGYDNSYNMAGKNMYNYRELGYYEHQLEIRNCVRVATLKCLIDDEIDQPVSQKSIAFPLLIVW